MGADEARALIPEGASLEEVREAAAGCTACRLHRRATQTVFGEVEAGTRRGTPRRVQVMLVGEQPGDREDLEGHPFVGPAGRELDRALEEAGIDRRKAYVTNVVKHFSWTPRGKRRIHKRPAADEIAACRPWLEAELELLRPSVIVCLGATAAQAIIGRSFRVTRQRGEFVDSDLAPFVTATIHPSAILRAPDDETRREERAAFVEDLRRVAGKVREAAGG